MAVIWDSTNDEYLARLVRMRQTVEKMALRFSCSVEEIAARVELLRKEGKIVDPNARADAAPEAEPSVEGLKERDPLQDIYLEMASAYEQQGERMAFLGRLLSMNLTFEQVIHEAHNIEAFHAKLIGKKMPLHLFILRMLWDNYLFVPRPRVAPSPSATNTDAATQPPGTDQQAEQPAPPSGG